MTDINFILAELEQKDPRLFHGLDNVLSQVYGLLMSFLTDELSPQQRKIWFNLAEIYPNTYSGIDLAQKIGSSKISKSIYQSIKILEQKSLILVDRKHPKNMVIQANYDHSMTKLLIELANQYAIKD